MTKHGMQPQVETGRERRPRPHPIHHSGGWTKSGTLTTKPFGLMGYLVSCESQRLWGLLQRTELTGFSVASSKAPWLPLPFIGLSGKQPRAEMSPQGVGLCFFWPVLPLLAKSTLRKTRGWIGRNSGLEFWFHHSVKKKEKRLCNLWQVTRPQFPHLENGNHFFSAVQTSRL